jgi:hypothetical protein
MIATLAAWLVISFVCWAWGYAFLAFTNMAAAKPARPFSLVCLTGFAIIAAAASVVSLFSRVGVLLFLFFFVLSSALFLIRGAREALKQNLRTVFNLSPPFLLLFFISSLLVMVMSVWHIIHPDTVEYHAAIIKSVKDFGVIKGYANENVRYGLQSNWFVACALFSFNLSGLHALTYANSIVLIWFLHYAITLLSQSAQQNLPLHVLPCIIFLGLAFLDFNQIRITSVSASPDFVSAIYVLLAVYLFIDRAPTACVLSIALFSATAITFKLSSAPVAIIPLLMLVKQRSLQRLFPVILITALPVLPFLLRNFFTSGYVLFPATAPYVARPHWQLDASVLQQVSDYITAYARTASPADTEAVRETLKIPFQKWLPVWWSLRNPGQKILLTLSIATLFTAVFFIRKVFGLLAGNQRSALVTAGIALISWFAMAPDPRFATAWLALFNLLIIYSLVWQKNVSRLYQNIAEGIAYGLSLSLFIYCIYRMLRYFDLYNIFLPYGLQ